MNKLYLKYKMVMVQCSWYSKNIPQEVIIVNISLAKKDCMGHTVLTEGDISKTGQMATNVKEKVYTINDNK